MIGVALVELWIAPELLTVKMRAWLWVAPVGLTLGAAVVVAHYSRSSRDEYLP